MDLQNWMYWIAVGWTWISTVSPEPEFNPATSEILPLVFVLCCLHHLIGPLKK